MGRSISSLSRTKRSLQMCARRPNCCEAKILPFMTDHAASANPSGKLVLAGMFLIALIIFAFEWRWHHGTHKLEFKVCLKDAAGLAVGAPVEFDGAKIGFVRAMRSGGGSCPTQAEIYL